MKKYLAILIAICFTGEGTYAQELNTRMTFDDLVQTAKNDTVFQEQSSERLKLLDINSDGIISYNEITNATTGVSEIPESMADEKQKETMKGYMLQAFEESDKDKNEELIADEFNEFINKMKYFLLKQKFDDMDKNHDGYFDINDIPTLEESMEQVNESLQKVQDTINKIDKMHPNEMAEGWVNSIGSAVADENFYQMDKDKNGCVNKEEYVNYQTANQGKDEADDTQLSTKDYIYWYLNINKAEKDCLTKDEYIADQRLSLEDRMNSMFDKMDKDANGKLTAEEYAEYNYQNDIELYAPNEPAVSQKEYQDTFMTIKAPDKGWLSKEEFIKDYLPEEEIETNVE